MTRVRQSIGIYFGAVLTVLGQGFPAREYVYFGSRLIAVEARGNAGPNDLNYVAPAPNLRRMTMRFQISDPDGGADISQLNVMIGQWYSNMRTCYFHWVKAASTVYLNNGLYGGSEEWQPMSISAGSTNNVESENCKIYRSGTGVSTNGSTLELAVDIEMRAPLGGALNILVWGRDNAQVEIGWEHMGTYTPTNLGGATAVTMLNGPPGSSTMQFQFHVPDPDGARNMSQLNIIVNNALSTSGGCYFVLVTFENQVWLNNGKAGALEDWSYLSLDSGSPPSITSDYCTVYYSGTSHAPVSGDPTKLGVTITVEFKPTMAGPGRGVWAWTRDMHLVSLGWIPLATWTIP